MPLLIYFSLYLIIIDFHGLVLSPGIRSHQENSSKFLFSDMKQTLKMSSQILILTWSSLRLSHIIFCLFVPELRPLIYTKILFPFIRWDCYTSFFNICTVVMALDWCQNWDTTQCPETLWPLILHTRHCSGAIVRFSYNSSLPSKWVLGKQ